MLTGGQVRAARGLLGWNQQGLADAAGIGFATIQRLERQNGIVSGNIGTIEKLIVAFENAGIEFIEENGGKGPGVRWRAPLSGH